MARAIPARFSEVILLLFIKREGEDGVARALLLGVTWLWNRIVTFLAQWMAAADALCCKNGSFDSAVLF